MHLSPLRSATYGRWDVRPLALPLGSSAREAVTDSLAPKRDVTRQAVIIAATASARRMARRVGVADGSVREFVEFATIQIFA